ALQFAEDLFELIQYPRIVRHTVFSILEKSVQSLATSLGEIGSEENQALLLEQPIRQVEDQSVFDFLFSDHLKSYFGNRIGGLFRNMSPKDNRWSLMGMGAKLVTWTISGSFVFGKLQETIEQLIQKKFQNREAVNWSAARLVVTLNGRIQAFAQDATGKGMKAVVASQLRKVIAPKEEKEPALL
ncbi:MAG: hypothetical protein ACHQ1H_12775, partial [Nitrososphaerales archaeon]